MSVFDVKVRRIVVSPHYNADALEVGTIDGYQFVVAKGMWQTGELGVYIPEQAIVPAELIAEMGLEGRLTGKDQNRVKAVKLRGVLSQGLFYKPPDRPLPAHWVEGLEVGAELGIIKYEPAIPDDFAGEVEAAPGGIFTSYTEIENIKKWPGVLQDGESVVMTEKLHGTCVIVGFADGKPVVSSKGLAGRGMVLREKVGNVYWKIARKFELFEKVAALMEHFNQPELLLFGEGLGVQDLKYGLPKGRLGFRAFDLLVPGGYLDYAKFLEYCRFGEIPVVPELFEGPFGQETLLAHTRGQSTLAQHIREGVVVKPLHERDDPGLGRVVLKSISEDYLLRKGDVTEFN